MSNIGEYFRVTTYIFPQLKIANWVKTNMYNRYGESHCKSVGCIVDGVPPGMELMEDDIQPK